MWNHSQPTGWEALEFKKKRVVCIKSTKYDIIVYDLFDLRNSILGLHITKDLFIILVEVMSYT